MAPQDLFTHFEPSQSIRRGKKGKICKENHPAICKQNVASMHAVSVEQIRLVFDDNKRIIFVNSP